MRFLRAAGLACLLMALTPKGPANAQSNMTCPTTGSTSGTIYTVEQFQQVWCWQPVPGSPLYHVETSTNGGPWIEEAVVDGNYVQLLRDLGDTVRLRLRACWGSTCSAYSQASQKVWVLPNFDHDGNGFVDGRDYASLRVSPSIASFREFRAVFGRRIVGQRYE